MLKIEKIINDYIDENTYLVIIDDKCLIIDPGSNKEAIIKRIGNLKPKAILITHNHLDHTYSKTYLEEYFDIKSYDYYNYNEIIKLGLDIDVIFTPGHTTDSITFYFKKDKIMFTGDFLFKESIGRYDFENSDIYDMINSINKIKGYDEDIVIYPGHYNSSTIGYEKNNNIYLKKESWF